MHTDITVLSFPMFIVLYLKLCFCLLCVAYFLGLFSLMSLFVSCGMMTFGAAVCHASY